MSQVYLSGYFAHLINTRAHSPFQFCHTLEEVERRHPAFQPLKPAFLPNGWPRPSQQRPCGARECHLCCEPCGEEARDSLIKRWRLRRQSIPRGGGCHGGRPREQEALRPRPRVGRWAPAPRPPLHVLTLRLPPLFRFRRSTLPLCVLTRPLPLPPPQAPNRRSCCFLPPRRLRFVECPRGPRGGDTVACSQSQAGSRVVELRLPRSAAKDLAEDRAALLALRGASSFRGSVRRAAAARLPSNRSVGLPLLSLAEADRSGTGSPP
jgi:hypothetical protein